MPNKKTYRKKRGYRRRKYPVLRAPIAPKFFTKLKYFDTVSINPGIGTVAGHLFSANGLYDPNVTGTGKQPRGWDQLITLYNHATVLGAKITCHFHNNDGSNPVLAGIRVMNDPTISSALRDYMEAGNGRHALLTLDKGSGAGKTVTERFSAKKEFGVTKVMDNHDLRSNATANPTEQGYFLVWAGAQDEVSDAASITVSVTIDYLVMFSEPNDFAGS